MLLCKKIKCSAPSPKTHNTKQTDKNYLEGKTLIDEETPQSLEFY